eukprot:TRINITY_DN7204_c0_g2_i1.p1 TRINITY_DN7204_c0_g2~~TRINITY_DN7204_c0_g2_i1.p1  ORF type:complete len:429 (-),score=96.21 TRINITY_DN7204_c0_g2_i1:52-1338(-)
MSEAKSPEAVASIATAARAPPVADGNADKLEVAIGAGEPGDVATTRARAVTSPVSMLSQQLQQQNSNSPTAAAMSSGNDTAAELIELDNDDTESVASSVGTANTAPGGNSPRSRSASALRNQHIDLNGIMARNSAIEFKVDGVIDLNRKKKRSSKHGGSRHGPSPRPVVGSLTQEELRNFIGPEQMDQLLKTPGQGGSKRSSFVGSKSVTLVAADEPHDGGGVDDIVKRAADRELHFRKAVTVAKSPSAKPQKVASLPDVSRDVEDQKYVDQVRQKRLSDIIDAENDSLSPAPRRISSHAQPSQPQPTQPIVVQTAQSAPMIIPVPTRPRRKTCCELLCFGTRYTILVENVDQDQDQHYIVPQQIPQQQIPLAAQQEAALEMPKPSKPRRSPRTGKSSQKSHETSNKKAIRGSWQNDAQNTLISEPPQ